MNKIFIRIIFIGIMMSQIIFAQQQTINKNKGAKMETIQSIAKLLLKEEKITLKFNDMLKEFNETTNIKEFYHLKHIKPYTK